MQQSDQEASSKYWWPDGQRSDHLFWRKHDYERDLWFSKRSRLVVEQQWQQTKHGCCEMVEQK